MDDIRFGIEKVQRPVTDPEAIHTHDLLGKRHLPVHLAGMRINQEQAAAGLRRADEV